MTGPEPHREAGRWFARRLGGPLRRWSPTGLEVLSLGRAVIRRPRLWPSARRLVPPRWWRRWPPLPLPPPDYARFRMETMYGAEGRLDPEELVRYLEWCRRMSARRDNV